jgi:AraC-like DNA-binding protein
MWAGGWGPAQYHMVRQRPRSAERLVNRKKKNKQGQKLRAGKRGGASPSWDVSRRRQGPKVAARAKESAKVRVRLRQKAGSVISGAAFARLPARIQEAKRLFQEITGFMAVTSFSSAAPSLDPSENVTPPMHPLCAASLKTTIGRGPCEVEWGKHLHRSLGSRSVQTHLCPLGLRCSCVPIYCGDALAGVAKCVTKGETSEKEHSQAVRVLELAISNACHEARASELSVQNDDLRERFARLQKVRTDALASGKPGSSAGADGAVPSEPANGRQLIDRTLEYLALHYLESPISLLTISRALGVSQGYLTRRFTQVVGQRMRAYVLQLRIQHACRLILIHDKSIKGVAFESGFNRIEVFRRTFRKYVGVSPTDYRRAFSRP